MIKAVHGHEWHRLGVLASRARPGRTMHARCAVKTDPHVDLRPESATISSASARKLASLTITIDCSSFSARRVVLLRWAFTLRVCVANGSWPEGAARLTCTANKRLCGFVSRPAHRRIQRFRGRDAKVRCHCPRSIGRHGAPGLRTSRHGLPGALHSSLHGCASCGHVYAPNSFNEAAVATRTGHARLVLVDVSFRGCSEDVRKCPPRLWAWDVRTLAQVVLQSQGAASRTAAEAAAALEFNHKSWNSGCFRTFPVVAAVHVRPWHSARRWPDGVGVSLATFQFVLAHGCHRCADASALHVTAAFESQRPAARPQNGTGKQTPRCVHACHSPRCSRSENGSALSSSTDTQSNRSSVYIVAACSELGRQLRHTLWQGDTIDHICSHLIL